MNYLYDVWVNWFEGEEQGYNVCHYHEWRKKDDIEVLERIPVVHISSVLFHGIENSLNELPPGLLSYIEKKANKRNGLKKEALKYAAIVSDGRGILAIHTTGYDVPMKKSRLIPRQEQQVFDICKKIKRLDFKRTEQAITYKQEPSLLSISPNKMIGLTRRERQLKRILLLAIDKLKESENRDELLYWLSEWDFEKRKLITDVVPNEVIWKMLYRHLLRGWGTNHEQFLKQFIKGNPFLENLLENEEQEQNHHQRDKHSRSRNKSSKNDNKWI